MYSVTPQHGTSPYGSFFLSKSNSNHLLYHPYSTSYLPQRWCSQPNNPCCSTSSSDEETMLSMDINDFPQVSSSTPVCLCIWYILCYVILCNKKIHIVKVGIDLNCLIIWCFPGRQMVLIWYSLHPSIHVHKRSLVPLITSDVLKKIVWYCIWYTCASAPDKGWHTLFMTPRSSLQIKVKCYTSSLFCRHNFWSTQDIFFENTSMVSLL